MVIKKILDVHCADWPKLIPASGQIKQFKLKWKLGSAIIVPSVAILSKIWLNFLNKTVVYNHNVFLENVEKNYKLKKNPLITISNHASCLDDPLIWGSLFPWNWNLNSVRHRWSAAAHDICFTNKYHSLFFSFGKSIPVHRGAGIYQPSINFLLELTKQNQFIHIFPQGKVVDENYVEEIELINKDQNFLLDKLSFKDKNDLNSDYSFKWGLARLILDYLCTNKNNHIDILPFYHIGMDKVLPTVTPYIPRINKNVVIFIRENGPLRFTNNLVKDICKDLSCPKKKRIAIMNYIELEMKKVKLEALKRSIFNI